MADYEILETKVVDSEKTIALVQWNRATFTEYSTHAMYPQGCDGLHHGNYYESRERAEANFKTRV